MRNRIQPDTDQIPDKMVAMLAAVGLRRSWEVKNRWWSMGGRKHATLWWYASTNQWAVYDDDGLHRFDSDADVVFYMASALMDTNA